MPQMKSGDNNTILETASTDSSVFDLDNPKSRNTETWSALSGATSSSSVLSSLSADGPPGELVARGTSTSQGQLRTSSPNSLIPSLMELTTSERIDAAGLKHELHGFMNKVTHMEDQLHKLKKMLVNKQKYISTLESNLKRIEGNNASLKSEVMILSQDNEVLRNKLCQQDTAGPSHSPTSRRRDLAPSPCPSERELQLGTELDRVLQENASLKQKIQGLEEELNQTIHQLEQTRIRHEQKRQDIELLLMQTSEQLEHVEAERDETAKLLTEVLNKGTGACKDEGGGNRTQFDSLLMLQKPSLTAKELTSIKDRLFAAHKQIDVLESDFREEHDQRLSAERDLARMKATIRDLERECDTLRLQVQFLQEDFYKEQEDKRVLERNLKAKNNIKDNTMHFHTRITSRDRNAQESDQYVHFYQGQTQDNTGIHQEMAYGVRPRTRYFGTFPSDVECDNSKVPPIATASAATAGKHSSIPNNDQQSTSH